MKGCWREEGDQNNPNRHIIQMPLWKCARLRLGKILLRHVGINRHTARIWPSARVGGICRDVPVDVPIQNLHFIFYFSSLQIAIQYFWENLDLYKTQ